MAGKNLKVTIITRNDTAANWTTKNPVLRKGEMGIEIDTHKFKFGDGTKTWNQLDYAADVYEWAKKQFLPISGTDGVTATSNADGATVKANLKDYTKNTAAAAKGTGSKIYAVELDKDGKLAVAVPWTDTDTVYTGNEPIVVDASAKTISHVQGGPSAGYTSGNTTTAIKGSGAKGTIKVPQITVDSYGHVSAAADENVDIELPSVGNGALTINVGKDGDTAGTGSFTANQTAASTITLPVYTKDEVNEMVVGAVQYLGTVSSVAELNALEPDSKGDFCRVSTGFTYNKETLHPGDLLLCETIKAGSTAATWSVIHGEIDKSTWVANSKDADGYVAKGSGHGNRVWKTDSSGNPAWREDDVGITGINISSAGQTFSIGEEISISTPSNDILITQDTDNENGILLRLARAIATSKNAEPRALATVGVIDEKIGDLDYTDPNKQTGYYVSGVTQTDGKIAVTREKLPDAVAPNSGKLTDRAGTEIFNANQSDDTQIMIIDCGTSSTVL